MKEIDLLIIGAGPAGVSTALHLLRRDPTWKDRMIVLDRAAHPRPKLCGGGVTQLGLRTLRGLGLPTPLPLPHAPVEDARFVYRGRTVHVRGNPEFVVFNRMEFDHFLAEEAKRRGVVICEHEAVQSLEAGAGGITVRTSREVYRARVVVGADGSRGVTARFVQPKRPNRRPSPVARLLEIVTPAPENTPKLLDRFAIFDFTPTRDDLQGYVWDFPTRVGGAAHDNRGVFDSRVAPDGPRAALPSLLEAAVEDLGADLAEAEVKGHPIHWFRPTGTFSAPHILLVGDAAGAEPLFGEGIGPALGYGRLAATVVERAFSRSDFSFSGYRRRLLFSRLGFYLTFRWAIASVSYRLSHRAWFMHAFWTVGKVLAAVKFWQLSVRLRLRKIFLG